MTGALVELDMRQPEVLVRAMLTTDQAVDLFIGDCTRRGLSERTTTTYQRILGKFCEHLPLMQDVSKVSADDCRRFLDGYTRKARGTQAHAFSVLSSFFGWMYRHKKITRNPMDELDRVRRIPAQDLNVTTVSADDVRRLIAAAVTWPERLAIGILVYMGPRRRAVARLKVADYDMLGERIRFREKGGKTIWKPVPDELSQLLRSAFSQGVYENQEYLVPAEAYLSRNGERDDRCVWRLVKRVGARAGVETHVHALRAAFACLYLESNPGDVEALRELMGHRSIATTSVYLRKLDRDVAMERVRSLSWT